MTPETKNATTRGVVAQGKQTGADLPGWVSWREAIGVPDG